MNGDTEPGPAAPEIIEVPNLSALQAELKTDLAKELLGVFADACTATEVRERLAEILRARTQQPGGEGCSDAGNPMA